MNLQKSIVGKKVLRLELSADNVVARFIFDGSEPVEWVCEGDCCSTSWFNDIDGVSNLIGETVTGLKEIELPDVLRSDDVHIQAYGIQVTTTKGFVDFVFRNESNGFYGGSVECRQGARPHTTWDGVEVPFRILDSDLSL